MSTRKSILKVNTTESPTKINVTMSAATTTVSLSPQTTSTTASKISQLEIHSKVSDDTDKNVATGDNTTTTSSTESIITTPTESATNTTTSTPTATTPTTTTTTVDKILATAENETSDSENLDTTTTTTTTNSPSTNIIVPSKDEQQISPKIINNTDLTTTTTTTTLDIKRGKRKSSSITTSPTCSQQINKKSSISGSDDITDEVTDDVDDDDEGDGNGDGDGGNGNGTITTTDNPSTINVLVEDKKLITQDEPSPNEEPQKQQKLIEEIKCESPVRVGRKKKVFDKTAIITRKSSSAAVSTTPTTAPTTPTNKKQQQQIVKPIINIRTSMRNRRNSTGKIDTKQNEPKKYGKQRTRKTLSSTPEPRTPIKRKREDSVKYDDKDEQQPIEKLIKIETDDEQQQQEHIDESVDDDDDDNIKNDEKDDQMIIDNEKTTKLLNESSILNKTDDDNKYLAYTKPRRGRPKLINIDKEKNITRKCRSDKKPIDPSLTLPEIKRPRRRGRRPGEKTITTRTTISEKDDDSSILDDTIKTHSEPTIVDDEPTLIDNNDDETLNLNGLEKPLTVDTTTLSSSTTTNEIETNNKIKFNIIDTIKNEIATTSSDKAASLSPELISEGVNVISVKQFYKKPEFLENNLGIEKDPKLGEIVQEVEKNTSTTTTTPTLKPNQTKKEIINKIVIDEEKTINQNLIDNESNNESLIEEGALHLDDEDEDEDEIDKNEINESNNKNIIKKFIEINKDDNNDDDDDIIINDDNNLNDNPDNIIKNQNIIKLKDSTKNKENNNSKLDKLNLCDKNHNNNENSMAVQIESINNKIIIDNDNNIKDIIKIQSECNNKNINNVGENEKDSKSKSNDDKKIILKNKILNNDDQDDDDDEQLLSSGEINSEISDITKNNLNAKSINKHIEIKKEEVDHQIDDDSIKIEDKMETDDDIKENISSKIEDDDNSSMEVVEENIENLEKLNYTSDDTNSKNSGEQNKKLLSNVNKRLLETPETMRQKEKHLKNLGLLTHKAAVQAKIDKQRRRKLLQNTITTNKTKQSIESSSSSSSSSPGSIISSVTSGNSISNNNNIGNLNKVQDIATTSNTTSTVYSIKSGENKRKSSSGNNSNTNNNGRQSLKITFQKGRGRGIPIHQSGEEIYYTIQNEIEGGQTEETVTHGRKSLNRNHTIDTAGSSSNQSDTIVDQLNKKDGKEKILIPEKASSFSIHPGRLCQDQCYYCGGRFGLYDTPCHVAQLKSLERQQKILANEEKLTVDNCLCDACFRHVDKRANVPSYKKRLSALSSSLDNDNSNNSQQNDSDNNIDEQQQQLQQHDQQQHNQITYSSNRNICFVPGCNNSAAHSLRKKCIRKTIKKILPNFDMSTIGGITPICSQHYDSILQYLGCALCKRRLGKNHMYHIQESEKLEILLTENNVPVQIGNSSAICKLCRYFTNLLMKPSTGTKQNDFVRSYRRRLLQFHNVQNDDDDCSDEGDGDTEKLKLKRNRSKKHNTTILDEKISDESSNSSPSLIIDENPSESSNSASASTSAAAATSGQMMLDNDVLVDYDVPIISSDSPTPSPPPLLSSKLKSILQQSNNNNINNNNNKNDKNNDITITNNKKEDISLVLRSNPNISMRELFPGEEEMGLHVNLPFGSSSSLRTPEGWTRVQTFLQYDEPTRRLWEDLQKPYGNQSSFLRHLILLEKYYRNGDLILSNNASSNASVYAETVQNRLRSYDNNNLNNNNNHIASSSTITVTPIINAAVSGGSVQQQQQQTGNRKNLLNKHSNSRSESVEKQINNNNNNNYPITITTRPKQQITQQSSTSTNNSNNNKNSTSISNNNNNNNNLSNDSIKSNLIVGNKNAIEILPILSTSLTKTSDSSNLSTSNLMTKQQKLLAAANKLIGNETAIDLKTITPTNSTITNKNDQKKSDNNIATNMSMPPELISINRQSSGVMIGKQQQQQQQTQQQRDQQQQQLQLQQQHQRIRNFKQQLSQQQQQQHHNKHNSSKHGIIVLPETLSPMETLNMKNWRPTLLPITSGAHLNQSGPLYKTVDGRKLPAVVQVQSRGHPYLISIHDYNRMCILRREKLLYDQMVKNGKIKHGMRPPTVLSPKILSSHQQQQHQQSKLKIPNKILEQNSLIPVVGNSAQRSSTATNSIQQQIANEQNRQMKLRQQQQQQISLLKSSTAGGNFVPILPKLTQNHQLQILPTTSNHTSMSLATSLVNNSVSIVPTITGVLSLAGTTSGNNTATLTSLTPSTIAGLNSSGVNMRNLMAAAQKQRFDQIISQQNYQKTNINNNRNNNIGGNLIGTSASSVILDNSLLSKIPKSLTVIPQQKLQSQQQGRTSSEDLTSA